MNQETIDYIALGLIKGMGPRTIRKVLEITSSISDFFEMSEADLLSIDRLSANTAKEILATRDMARKTAEKEAEWAQGCMVDVVTFNSNRYPARLRACEDAPIVLYSRGDADFNARKVLSVVGTRRPTPYGRQWCTEVLSELASRHPDLLVVSGLAYGIDVVAHVAALDNNLKTVGVVAHGMDTLYPSQHKEIAKRMVMQGGAVLTEFRNGTQPEAVNFVSRNRIVAGMADVTLVVESGAKGGSLITANKAHEYGRTVAALPGAPAAEMSMGPNKLIREHKAELVTCAEDIESLMSWIRSEADSHPQGSLFAPADNDMDPMQTKIYHTLMTGELTVDEVSRAVSMPVNEISAILLEMEFMGIVVSLAGNRYAINRC